MKTINEIDLESFLEEEEESQNLSALELSKKLEFSTLYITGNMNIKMEDVLGFQEDFLELNKFVTEELNFYSNLNIN